MHADQLAISEETVRRLVGEQFPEWSKLDVRPVASEGTANAIFRIGPELAARFPLRANDPTIVRAALESEQAAARELSSHVSVPVPKPVALGRPGAGYPLPWAVQTWLTGTTATSDDPGASTEFAHDLAVLIAEIRAIPTNGRVFAGSGRGGHLPDHDAWMAKCFAESEALLDVPALRALWRRFRELPSHAGDVMSHRDLIAGNVLVASGRLAGILDVGGFGASDPSLDLICAWHLLEAGPRETLRNELRCTPLEWERGKAWAFQQAMGWVWYYVATNPSMCRLGRRTLDRLVAAERTRA
jgi:aminoglycoside phosphotransferase (APT) family kinase protein